MLTKEQRQSIIDVLKGDLLPDDLDPELGFATADDNTLRLALLEDAASSNNAEDIERAIRLSYQHLEERHNLGMQAVPVLIKLLALPYHYMHEDIIQLFQHLKDIRTVDAIYDAALISHEYLHYDETFGLARRCTWVLADIGNESAYHKLQLLAANSNPHIAGYAQKRLNSWDKVADRN
jgi:hypothetical protein